ncbi:MULTISPECIES: glycosyltransferase family 2 protein [Roseivirga]|jgi:glycosyltransferase involved in cell wall biosynthesis|uniref:glycosyltransferase family 2 protein n=1 Tax=Roseivirga TaxID=290180 RepID=UPI001B1590F5|nr:MULTISPECIES: glycosyltransferase family 2 protein [Roseivirga]MBO6494017.1 glycosyltransferase family 2 protein [Roseivirga sp.]MCO6359839.1 glycosyltransferase [Roseivirga pacifica]MCO6367209.1 glycosyltransferase [Roseivirga pacifica]MCO6370259.1 glycosyltransferase [Roseivirga pacifica]MCO6374866.1 glycosyltransferase [Roseivirga pacifica]
MIKGKKLVVIMPAYNAESTLEKVYKELNFNIVDDVILTDDFSSDQTLKLASELGIKHLRRHDQNLGYGANQKTCYHLAKEIGADIIIMVHPDYQYTPKLVEAMASIIANNIYPVVLGSRILGKGAIKGGMPIYKYLANRILTLIQNILMNQKLSEYHTGLRAFSIETLNDICYENNSDDFIFDNEMLAQILYKGHQIGEVTCPTSYFPEASSINLSRSIKYGFGVLRVSFQYFLGKLGVYVPKIFRAPTA